MAASSEHAADAVFVEGESSCVNERVSNRPKTWTRVN